jgi:non-ribosomal peptide synthase protein (TIGR01720 family)
LPVAELWIIPATENAGATRRHDARRIYLLDVQADVIDDELHLDWFYSRNVHKPETVEELSGNVLAALRELIRLSSSSPQIAFAPSDFPNAQLSQADLDRLIAQIPS